jgi:DNA-directed RNA polymerase sigma subunit (sigma70/sigma32)
MDLVSGIARPFKEWADGVEGELTAMRKNYIDSTYGRLDHLETRQKDIILKRRGEGGERWTLDRLSKYYGITKQRIWSIEKAAIAKFAVRNSDGQT